MYINQLILLSGDLFSREWTEGNLNRIPWLVNVLGTIVGIVISAGGFGIVAVSIAKNVFSAVYLLAPKFWDNVDAVKKAVVDGVEAGINAGTSHLGGAGTHISGIASALFKLLPNIKDLTDFAGDDGKAVQLSAKGYFLSAVPKLIAAVCLGMLVFYGYTTKFAEAAGNTMSYALDSTLDKFDPEKMAQTINKNLIVLKYSTADSTDPADKVTYKASKEAMSIILAQYPDMEKQPKQETAYAVEALLQSVTHNSDVEAVISSNSYKVTANAAFFTSVPVVSSSYLETSDPNIKVGTTTNGGKVFKYSFATSTLPLGTAIDNGSDYIQITLNATPVAASNVSTTEMVAYTGLNTVGTVVRDSYKITLPGLTLGDGSGELKGSLGRSVTAFIYNSTYGTDPIVLNPIIESTSNGKGSIVLNFDKTDKDTITNAQFIKLELSGSWTISIVDGSNTATWQVGTVVASKGNSSASYMLTSSPDYDENATSGKDLKSAIAKDE